MLAILKLVFAYRAVCRKARAYGELSITFLFSTGSWPGIDMHIGHVWVFSSPPKCVEQPQYIFDSV
jgi:hypothetical protein